MLAARFQSMNRLLIYILLLLLSLDTYGTGARRFLNVGFLETNVEFDSVTLTSSIYIPTCISYKNKTTIRFIADSIIVDISLCRSAFMMMDTLYDTIKFKKLLHTNYILKLRFSESNTYEYPFCTFYEPTESVCFRLTNDSSGISLDKYFCDNKPIEPLDFEIYPNPVLRQLNINIPEEIIVSEMSLVDICGRKIWFRHNITGNEILDVSAILKGIYILYIQYDEKSVYKKVVRM